MECGALATGGASVECGYQVGAAAAGAKCVELPSPDPRRRVEKLHGFAMDDIQQESVTLPGGQALLLIGSAAVVTFSAVMLCHFAQREVSWFSFITSLAGFVLSFIIITLVPYDVAQSLAVEVATERGQRVDQVLVSSSWQFIYWATFLLCWLVFPVLMEYEAAGGFTVVGRLRSSIRRSTAWCAGYLVCAGLLVLWLVLGGTGTAGVGAWCIAASNAWGLLVSTFLMGHGLVAVPRQLWRQARPGESLARLYGQAARLDEERLSAQFELQDVLAEARAETSQRSIQFWDPSLERAFALLQQTMEECELLHLELTNGAVRACIHLSSKLRQVGPGGLFGGSVMCHFSAPVGTSSLCCGCRC
eukprot:s409_g6.t1